MLSWPQLQGRILGGGYRLIRYLNGSETSGQFEATDGTDGRKFLVQLFSQTPQQGRERLDLWRNLQLLNRPEMLKIISSGTAGWPDLHFEYVVNEFPDESLAGVLVDRALDVDEARQVLESAAAALVVMHDRQCVHASVQPGNVYAVGDRIKLSVATVQRPGASETHTEPSEYQAPEVSSFAFSPASDIFSLGVTLFQALTRNLPSDDAMERVDKLPAPFPAVLKHSLDPISAKRWTARQILESLGVMAPERPPLLEAPPPAAPPEIPPRRLDLGRPKGRRWVSPYAIAAIVLFLAFLWLIFGHKRRPATPVGPRSEPASVATAVPSAPTPARVSPTPAVTPPSSAVPAPPRHQPILQKENVPAPTRQSAVDGSSAIGPVNWRVIVYTFVRENDATQRAAAINHSHPDLHAEVFSPQADRYLVTLGTWLPVQDAKRLRQQAVAQGMPHDTYIQNFHRP